MTAASLNATGQRSHFESGKTKTRTAIEATIHGKELKAAIHGKELHGLTLHDSCFVWTMGKSERATCNALRLPRIAVE
ncbi:MAG TPA: hypothetical protein VFP92_08945 [Rhodanobacteraceae bacterium]|nr:hypothetical protein [Rhodanobacteraceae bacterium]